MHSCPVTVDGKVRGALWSQRERFLGSGGLNGFAWLGADVQLLSTGPPNPSLQAGAASRYFPRGGISCHSFLIDLGDASVEAALPRGLSRMSRDRSLCWHSLEDLSSLYSELQARG